MCIRDRCLRPAQAQGRQLAGRIRLPDLLGPRSADSRGLPRLRSGTGASGSPPESRRRDLHHLRRLQPVVRLHPMRVRGQAARWAALHPLHLRRPAGRGSGRRVRPDPARTRFAVRLPASDGQPAVRPHLGDLLMSCGVLPTVDKQICSFERWLVSHLADITDPDHVQLARRFATWEVLPHLRTRAEKKPITPAGRRHAGEQVKHAAAFLRWLSERGLVLSTCRQADIDAWHIEHNEHGRDTLRAFLLWCMANKLTRRFRLPAAVIRQATSLPQPERVGLLGRLLTGHDLPLRPRVAAAIVLLYAQPLSRVVRLTIDDVIRGGDHVLLRLGEPPSPVPGPVADLLLEWIENRDNMNTATNRDSRWLFPGRRAGQPMHPESLAALVNGLGIPTVAGRASAIRQPVLEMPAPVVADALGYHPVTTAKLASQAGGTWSRYAAGDHQRSPSGWTPRRTHDS